MKKVIFLFLLFFLSIVNALGKEYVDTEYIDVYFNGVVNDVFISNKAVYMEHQGIPLYCLDFSIPISRETGYDVYNFNDLDNYTNDQKNYIEYMSFFGYKYKNHSDIYYYLAAQELIWGTLGYDVYWTYTRYGGDVINLEEYKMDILNIYSEYLNENYLYNDYYAMKIGSSYKYFDYSDKLPEYEFEYTGNNSIIYNPREITFYASNSGEEKIRMIRNYDKGFESQVFIESNYQTIIKPGSITNKEKILNIVIFNTEINLNRIDRSNILNNSITKKNAVYELYDSNNNLIKYVLSNDNGEIIFPDLPFGSYSIKERNPSYGYEKYEEVLYVDLFYETCPVFIDITINRIKKELNIINIYKENNIEYFDEGIMFEIYKDDALFEIISTNNNGKASSYLEYGNYSIKQINSRDGFEIEPIINFVVNEFENNLDYLFYKELTVEEENADDTVTNEENREEESENASIIIEESEEQIIETEEENEEQIIEIEEEPILIEYDDSKTIPIEELPQLFDEEDIFRKICVKLLSFCLPSFYYLY